MYKKKSHLKFKSEDFKITVPSDCKNIPEFLMDFLNKVNPHTSYIIDDYGEDWVRFININDPQDTVNFIETS